MNRTIVELALLLGLLTPSGELVGAVKPVPATPALSAPVVVPRILQKRYVVTVSSYNLLARQTDSTPTVAAWGNTLKPTDRICAVSRDLEAQGLWRHSKLYIPGYGYCTIQDRMHKRWKMTVDVLLPTEKESMQWGRQRNLIMTVVIR